MKENSALPSYPSLLQSVRSARQSGVPVPAQMLFPTCYTYSGPQTHARIPDRYLRVIGGGSVNLAPGVSAALEPVDGMFLIDTLCGGGSVTCREANRRVAPGSLALVDGSNPFSLSTERQSWSFRIFFLAGADLDLFLPCLPSVHFTRKHDSPPLAMLAETLAAFPGEIDSRSLLDMHRTLTNLLTEVCLSAPAQAPATCSQTHTPYLQDMHAYIHDLRHRAFSLSALEDRYGISRYRLCREYQTAFRTSPLKDFNHIRILEAKKLLLTTNLQVQEVSSSVGYDNVSHFINLFKSETGRTPNAFRHISRT